MVKRDANRESRIGRRLKLRDLQILSTVIECGSMAKGARQIGMSQPAVSESIASLEDALQVRLLDRSPKGVVPTIYANALLERAHVVFDELEQGIRDIEFLADPGVGEVRIGCPESLMAGFVPAIIDRILRQHPRVVVHVANAQPGEHQFRALHERTLDLMLGRVLVPVRDADVEMEVLCEDKFFVVAGARSRWTRSRNISLTDLEHEPWVMFPNNSVITSYFANATHPNASVLPRGSVETFSMHVRMQLLATGRFLTILHNSTLRYYAKPWSLKVLPIDLPTKPAPISVFTLRDRTQSPVVRLFIEHARAVSKSLTEATGRTRA